MSRFEGAPAQTWTTLAATLPERIDLTGDELAAFHESIKFTDCMPRQLLSKTIVARNFEMTSEDRRR